ncbi:alpha-1,3-mannosyl-glycoprotein 4-beta-N-acetylglucosaminyltransferase B-like [Ptychodera flava]|uniref:alpha-1,3-mannosyl-glycoprotein 4-beta-N-acetylglucosaminyltransferase B-like n=1 Tax=Ptychodera flava TaxID=63121 RepID=UPI00396A5E91
MALRRNGIVVLSFLVFLSLSVVLLSSRSDNGKVANQLYEQKFNEVVERLRYAEKQNQARSQELFQLKEQIAVAFSDIKVEHVDTNNTVDRQKIEETKRRLHRYLAEGQALQVPSAIHYLPHLLENADGLQPAFLMSQGRVGVSVVIGMPTIKREVQSYILDTLKSLVDGLSDEEKLDCVIIVFIGETDLQYVTKQAEEIKEKFSIEVDAGLIEVISPPANYYPDLDNVKETFGDPKDRVKWRTKQNLDFSFLMMYAQTKGTFYVQLEDDIIAKPGYITTMKNFAMQQKQDDWVILEFSSLGFIGKLFKASDLNLVVEFFLMFHKDKPIDWLLDHILWVKVCHPEKDNKHCAREKAALRIRFKPSLFQHIGMHSSLPGKVQKLKDKDFGKQPLHRGHENPPAVVSTSIKIYMKYTLEKAYRGSDFFWGIMPKAGDEIVIKFTQPIIIDKYRFTSGNTEHPGDVFSNTTVEVLPHQLEQKQEGVLETNAKSNASYRRTEDGFYQVGEFVDGKAGANVDTTLGEIDQMRIRVLTDAKAWVILSEIHIVPGKR